VWRGVSRVWGERLSVIGCFMLCLGALVSVWGVCVIVRGK
jgi:hypothetical protein